MTVTIINSQKPKLVTALQLYKLAEPTDPNRTVSVYEI
jgi:hypothetical protein